MMYKTTDDGWDMKKSIQDDVRNSFWWMRPMNDNPYLMVYKTTVDGRQMWRNSYQAADEHLLMNVNSEWLPIPNDSYDMKL